MDSISCIFYRYLNRCDSGEVDNPFVFSRNKFDLESGSQRKACCNDKEYKECFKATFLIIIVILFITGIAAAIAFKT